MSTIPESLDRKHLDADTFRLVPSRFPPVAVFENLLSPDELDEAYRLEALTNDRLRDQAGDIHLVAPEERVVGPGSTPIMAAFTHIGVPSRFTDGRYGVYYASLDLTTALHESCHSRSRLLSATAEPPTVLMMRCYQCRVRGELVDLREEPRVHEPDSHEYSRAVGARLREQGESGVLYRSVRHANGECIGVFRPPVLIPPAAQSGHYEFHWDGRATEAVMRVDRERVL